MKNSIKEHPAHIFENGEVFIATASIENDANEIEWYIPSILLDDFTVFANTNEIHDVFDEPVLKKYKDWFQNNIEADNDSVFITISVSYSPKELFQITDSNLRYNQTDCIENIKPNALSECYIDLEQKSAAYIIDNTIVSIAFDNKNGSITVLTLPEYRNMGYATKCLKKLIQVYPRNELGYATSIENEAAIRVAEKSGMKKTGI